MAFFAKSSALPSRCFLPFIAFLLLLLLFYSNFPSLPMRSLQQLGAPTFQSTAKSLSSNHHETLTSVMHSPDVFELNYKEMEKNFKVYIYPDGDPNTFYQTPRKLTGKYASEGYFFQNIRESVFRTQVPEEADMFFIPISCHKMRGKATSYETMSLIVHDYVALLIQKYPYWNRTLGADHFFVTCHDVGVRATENVTLLVKNSVRIVCSPSYNVGFIPHKDVALPQILQPFALPQGGDDIQNSNRISRATGELVYQKQFYRSKFCICPGGSQVNSARIADSIHYACVPVILSDYYDLPYNDILKWHKFSIILKEQDVVNLKTVLQAVTDHQYIALHRNLRQVQRHFEWHTPPGQQTHEVGESSRPPQTDDDIFGTQLITAVTMFTQVMQNPRFLAFLQPPLPSQQAGSLDHVQKPVKAQAQVIHTTESMETPIYLTESPIPMPNVQEQVAETPIVQAVPVQPATFQQLIAGSNGQGSNLQAMQQVFPPPSVHPGYFGGGSVFQSMAGHAPGNHNCVITLP
ncbi:hypothetical protein L7F22_046432 [Adiantum nelumboides]|nr:hypothetical protein [Adiantum nelumboides]